jgi:hypothetical protein
MRTSTTLALALLLLVLGTSRVPAADSAIASRDCYTVDETAATLEVGITRTGSGTGTFSVPYATRDGDAIAGTHYVAAAGILTWGAGETGEKSIPITLLDSGIPDHDRSFSVAVGAATAYDQEFFVDSASGSDAADGRTPGTAFRTIGCAVAAAAGAPRTAINLRRGGYWREQLLLAAADCVVRDYGSGPMPICDGADVIGAADWTAAAGYDHVFSCTRVGLNTASQMQTIWEDGKRLVRVASLPACEATPGSFVAPTEASFVKGQPFQLHVHASGGGSPSTNGLQYETQAREWCVYLGDQTHLRARVIGVEARRAAHHNGCIQVGRLGSVEGCVLAYGTIHALYIDSGRVIGCTSYDCEFGFDFVANKGVEVDGEVTFVGCVADIAETRQVINKPGFFVHGNTMAKIAFRDCASHNHQTGFAVGAAHGSIEFSRCVATCPASTPTFKAYFPDQDVGPAIVAVTLDDCLADGQGEAINAYRLNAGSTVTARGMRVITHGPNEIAVRARTGACSVSSSAFFSPDGSKSAGYIDPTGSLQFDHNIVEGYRYAIRHLPGGIYHAAANYYANVQEWHYSDIAYRTLAAFAAASGEEAGSGAGTSMGWTEVPTEAYSFALASGSPASAIGAGYDPPAPPLPAAPDLATIRIRNAHPALALLPGAADVAESAGPVTVAVVRRGGGSTTARCTYASHEASASAGDFSAISGSLSWALFDRSERSLPIAIVDDLEAEGDEHFDVGIAGASGAIIAASACRIDIRDDDTPAQGALRLASGALSVDEAAGVVVMSVDRIGGTAGDVSIAYASSDGSASASSDYVPASGILAWASGDAAPKQIALGISADDAFEGDETLMLTLADATGGAVLGSPSSATVTIRDDDSAVQFTVASILVDKGSAPSVALVVSRAGVARTAISVDYATVDATALASRDYASTMGTLSWAAGDASSRGILVALLDDGSRDESRLFAVSLAQATGAGAHIGSPAFALVTLAVPGSTPPPMSTAVDANGRGCGVGAATGLLVLAIRFVRLRPRRGEDAPRRSGRH